ncbi:uncharacterized protein SCDLUD_003404 [Saccharomycodes ludwigii]|uniref:uncharacterized protein n=1 Tax=Saccharomycodes ludwigii TaxID=36035 RepID=UPI001E823F81|nr:hypothetical protein SCDLUD_003404 [Saccharomycodes ludwigii]KAH3900424.1 hypothetical protein SCDLUD_003404 [Saccharomycodes ludwigii]
MTIATSHTPTSVRITDIEKQILELNNDIIKPTKLKILKEICKHINATAGINITADTPTNNTIYQDLIELQLEYTSDLLKRAASGENTLQLLDDIDNYLESKE